MHHLNRGLRGWLAMPALALVCVALAACGSSGSGNATQILKDTFSGSHRINSGNLTLSLGINPSGSSTISGPITLSFGGPFQSQGAGKIPQSNFNINVSALGRNGSLGLISTGTSGYVTLQGASYQLPQATFQRIESSFTQLTSSSGSSSNSSALSRLGIRPLDWLVNPTVVGDDSVAGTPTTHIRAGVNVNALLNDLDTFLRKASSTGVSGASTLSNGLSASTRSRIAGAIQNPSVDVWTGKSDKTLRRLAIKLTLPVTGQISTALGGLRSAGVGLTVQYANLNQPQTISAPTSVHPYGEFTAKVRTLLQNLQTGLGAIAGGGGAGSVTPGSSSSGGSTSSSKNVQAYSRCIQQAGNDVAKMQQCAPLLNGG
jgi:hypothetical protein